jgi:hypothetical protein
MREDEVGHARKRDEDTGQQVEGNYEEDSDLEPVGLHLTAHRAASLAAARVADRGGTGRGAQVPCS